MKHSALCFVFRPGLCVGLVSYTVFGPARTYGRENHNYGDEHMGVFVALPSADTVTIGCPSRFCNSESVVISPSLISINRALFSR